MNKTILITNRYLNIFLILLFITAFFDIDEDLTFFVKEFKTTFIILFLVTLTFITYELITKLYLINQEKSASNHVIKIHKANLENLSYDEKFILSQFCEKQSTELSLDQKNPSVQILSTKKIIINTSKVDGQKTIFHLQPMIYKELRKNPNLLY